jgi:hypothetical protein
MRVLGRDVRPEVKLAPEPSGPNNVPGTEPTPGHGPHPPQGRAVLVSRRRAGAN